MRGRKGWLPRLWLFTDDQRLPDPRASVAALPRGRAGVVLRHDRHPNRAALGQDLARICKARRLTLVVAGDWRLAASLHAGSHIRAGHRPGPVRLAGPITSSAHNAAELRRACAAGADLVFVSPAFPTASHAGAPGLGPLRWAAICRGGRGVRIAALGGVNGRNVKRLPSGLCSAVGAIGALAISA
jgi:thiamine-phosphate pyrophosphorylase